MDPYVKSLLDKTFGNRYVTCRSDLVSSYQNDIWFIKNEGKEYFCKKIYPAEEYNISNIIKAGGENLLPVTLLTKDKVNMLEVCLLIQPRLTSDLLSLINSLLSEKKDDRVVELIIRMCNMLKEFHKIGFHHNDVKLENFLYDDETGDIRLTDFQTASQSRDIPRGDYDAIYVLISEVLKHTHYGKVDIPSPDDNNFIDSIIHSLHEVIRNDVKSECPVAKISISESNTT